MSDESQDKPAAKTHEADADWLFSQNLALYTGEWVAILDRTILAHGPSLKRVHADAMKKAGSRSPLFYSVPSGILGGT